MTYTTNQIALLRLSLSQGLGSVGIHKLLKQHPSAEAALHRLQNTPSKTITIASSAAVEATIAAATAQGGFLVFMGDTTYPQLLATLPDAPVVLFGLGSPHVLNMPSVAMVGNRNASSIGQKLCWQIAKNVAKQNICVVSGLARGIDAAAHKGALAADGTTVAVVAGGPDVVYPPEHASLHAEIAQKGCIISEMPFGTPPTAHHFPRRNRIISGLCKAVAVMECSLKSGSLITAHTALEQGRELLAMPGSPADPRSSGPNSLLRQGAMVLETADDILALYPTTHTPSQGLLFAGQHTPEPQISAAEPQQHSQLLQDKILALLSPTVPLETDDILRQTGHSWAEVSTCLLELEIDRKIKKVNATCFISNLS